MGYTLEAKAKALRRLDALGGVYAHASAETGISARTLRHWAREREKREIALRRLENGVETLRERQQEKTDKDETDPIFLLHEQLVGNALLLADSLKEVIEAAPLSQRASALIQLIDKIIRLSDMLPQREVIIRFEYEDAEDNPRYQEAHSAEGDYQE